MTRCVAAPAVKLRLVRMLRVAASIHSAVLKFEPRQG